MTSRDRRRVPIPLGGGLDREAGIMVAPPTSLEDSRNLFQHQGKVVVRRGFERQFELVDGEGVTMTDVLAGQALRSQRQAVYVGYHQPTGRVEVFRGDGFGQSATWIGQWFTLPAEAAPPIVLTAESYERVFLAHDHASEASRAKTIYYQTSDDALHDLTGDFGGGEEDVKFRGVERHLNYLWGWGFAGNGQTRADTVRVSLPGNPVQFNREHYINVGDAQDAVIRCIPAGSTLLAFKETETHECFGYGRGNFGTRMLDPIYGIGVSRLAVNVSGVVFAWTNEGPRLYDGSWGSDSLELPLELVEPEPATLVPEGNIKYAFAEHLPVYRVVVFVWGRRVYALTVRVPGDWKWGYWELAREMLCGFRLPSGPGGLVTAPTSFPDNLLVSITGFTSATGAFATVDWDNNGQDGDEYAEVWVKPSTGDWSRWTTVPVTLDPNPQQVQLTGLLAGIDYEWAVRHRRGPFYTDGYESSDPNDWPASSRSTFTTPIVTPSIQAAAWSRTSALTEQILLTILPVHANTDIEILRGGIVIATTTAPSGMYTFADEGLSPEAFNSYTVRHVTPDAESSISSPTDVWGGPVPMPSGITVDDNGSDGYDLTWELGRGDLFTEVWDSWEDGVGAGTFPETLRATLGLGIEEYSEAALSPAPSSDAVTVGVRHKETKYGVDDFSYFSFGVEVIA